MRKASMILGLCGGAAGIIVHLALLGRLLVGGGYSSGELARLVIAVLLGIAAVAASLATRRSLRVAAIFLISLGFLGLFPRPLTWIPAACLLLAAGGSALYLLRLPTGAEPAEVAAHVMLPTQVVSATDSGTLHWSEAARLFRKLGGTAPTPAPSPAPAQAIDQATVVSPSNPVPTQTSGQPSPPAPEPLSEETDEEPAWSLRGKGLTAVAVMAAAAVVIPLSLWSPDSVAEASEPNRLASSQASDPRSLPDRAAPEDILPDGVPGPGDTTTIVAPTTTVPPFDTDEATWYSNLQYSLTMAVPVGWMEVDHTALADHEDATYHVAGFAQMSGPTHNDAYLNVIDVDIMFDARIDEYAFPLLEQALQQIIADGPEEYYYFHVLEPIREVEIGGTLGLTVTARVTWEGRVMVQRLFVCTANHCLYRFGFQTDDAEWDTYEPLFDDVVDTISFGPQGSRI